MAGALDLAGMADELVASFRSTLAEAKAEITDERKDRVERALRRLAALTGQAAVGQAPAEEEFTVCRAVLENHRAIAALAIATASTRFAGAAGRILRAFAGGLIP